MLTRLRVWAVSTGGFWKARSWFSRQIFRAEKLRHDGSSGVRAQIQKSRIGWQLIWIGLKKFLAVGFSLLALEYAEHSIVDEFQLTSWPDVSSHDDYNGQLEFYAVLLAAIFSIYFATIGIILSTGYAKLNRKIISLLIGEQVGNLYTSILIFATAFCLTVTAINIFDHQTGLAVYVVSSCLTVLSVLTLFPIGRRLFEFFELTPLIDGEIVPKIVQNIERVAQDRNSISYQNHFSQLTKTKLKQLDFINEKLQTEQSKVEQSLPLLTKRYSGLLAYYLQHKHKIPEDSYWFPRIQFHPNWFLAGDSATSIALQTSSQLPPEERPDLDWLEKETLEKIHQHLERALKAKRWELSLRLVLDLSLRASVYANGLYFKTGLDDFAAVRLLLEKYLPELEGKNSEASKHAIALADTWVAIVQNFFLETLRRIQTFDKELMQFFAEDDWSFVASKNLPIFLQVKIRPLQKRIVFEQKIEQRRLSRPKYLQQLTIKAVLEEYIKIVETVADFESIELPKFTQTLVASGHPAAATQVVLSTLHSNWKLPGWYDDLDRLFSRYAEYQRYDDEMYKLPALDFAKVRSQFKIQRSELMKLLSDIKLGSHLFSSRGHDTSLPDHFGQTYFVLANECLNALHQNDEDVLERVSQTFFGLAFLAVNFKFIDPDLDVNQEFRLHLVSSANKDLATLLGFAILYSEHHQNEALKTIPLQIWEGLIEAAKDRKGYLERTILLSDSRKFSMSASPRDMIRAEWTMKFEALLRDAGYNDRFSSHGPKHPSDIVDEFRGGYYSASDVFFALHILDEVNLSDDQVGHRITRFKSRLERREGEAE
ncbi:hypothetical protein R1T40_18460 [Tritonibacter scottomollicae]|uniref:DUF2254 domain-containing protein n=1 Tax=Tritonibacter scottomollicae TaxID=483013 RepID=A0ABZ0HG22_TRISK|nr:hypothetical protein [Tritonibacter scottomollicae]WOI32896.1 hypothetical protein R1T40_18460 [Tritonibacter scottomollicae]